MLILALDTTTRAGSLALARDGTPVAAEAGDASRTHGERLPDEIAQLLSRQRIALPAIDLFAVAAGPGSFTGLRIGIATMQGLALAHGRGLVGISALDALAFGAREWLTARGGEPAGALAIWMDAHRREVFAALYRASDLTPLDGPTVAPPGEVLVRWAPALAGGPVWFTGDGALAYRQLIAGGAWPIVEPVPLVAPGVAALAARQIAVRPAPRPETIRPLYVRRPDAELARDRAKARIPG
jgi:tRNA threonylcarbamoyladenosine biosynthesis protein TsaB